MYLTRPIQQTPTSIALAIINTTLVLTVGQGHTLRLQTNRVVILEDMIEKTQGLVHQPQPQ